MDRKQQPDGAAVGVGFNASDLPDAALACIFSFIPFNERVEFAMSLPIWKEDEVDDTSKLIIGARPVYSIDFSKFNTRVARNLTDNDLRRILISVDAARYLKILKLHHCIRKCEARV